MIRLRASLIALTLSLAATLSVTPSTALGQPDKGGVAVKPLLRPSEAEAVILESEKLDRDGHSPSTTSSREDFSFLPELARMFLMLGAICVLAYLLLAKLLPRLLRIQPPVANRRLLEVIDRLPIDQRRSIIVLKIGAQHFLVGVSDQSIALLSRLDSDEILEVLRRETSVPSNPAFQRLAGIFNARSEKRG